MTISAVCTSSTEELLKKFNIYEEISNPLEKRFCLYARKSSEEDERQALSIDSQIKEMLILAQKQGLNVVEVRKESHSAKASGMRPVFNQLISDIQENRFNSLLTWSTDRLSRNAGDLGKMVDLMDQGRLIEIRTMGQNFTNSPNEKFLLMILGSQAKLENDNRGLNVKRGLKTRAETGRRPCMVPLGYEYELTPDRKSTRIVMDKKKGPIIKEMFEKISRGELSGRKAQEWLFNEKKILSRNNRRVSLSCIYRMLKNSFYYGMYEYPIGSGNWYEGNHNSLITKEVFDKVQKNLKIPDRTGYRVKEFGFTRILKCGSCGNGITAEEKFKYLKDGTRKKYVYYHCSNPIKTECTEPYIRSEDLMEQLLRLVDKVDFDKIGLKERFETEIAKFQNFTKGMLGGSLLKLDIPKVDAKHYAKYIIEHGSRDDRDMLLGCIKSKLIIKGKKVSLVDEC